MNSQAPKPKESKVLVCLFSDPNFLAINIFENLLSENCLVNIITNNKKEWLEKTSNLGDKSKFFLTSTADYKKITNFSYAIFCGGFLKKQTALDDFKIFITNKNFGAAKTLAVFPFETFNLKKNSKISIKENAGIIYIGDLLGPRIDLKSNLLIPTLIRDMIEKRILTLGIGELFYPLLVHDVSRVITKWLLSFGPYGRETFLLGPQIPSSDFWKQNIKSFPDLKVAYDTDIETRSVPKGHDTKRIATDFPYALTETYKWLIKSERKKEVKSDSVKVSKPKERSSNLHKFKYFRPIFLILFLILLLPLITSLISSGFLYMSYKNFLSNDIHSSQRNALLAKTIYSVGESESLLLSKVPVFGLPYKESYYASYLGKEISDSLFNTIPVVDSAKSMLTSMLGTGVYDVKVPSTQLKSAMEYFYQQISMIQISTEESAAGNVLIAKQVLNIINFDKYKNLLQQGTFLANNLPDILGDNENKNYLILFQNNMELRPTGGFIGSYGVGNFGGGKLNGLTVNDVYSADGQLKGHVEPPSPIKNYLGEANWWFRDSNWDPDFPTSAQRAEWFLGKEMNQKVDGVFAIDLTPIKNILEYTGPIFLPDYNLTITSSNLYEKTQEEAQSNFFPGSRKKASFLTALSRVLLSEISKMDSKQKIGLLKVIYDGLESRDIQIYLHDTNSQSAIEKLSWDGKVPSYSCGDGCYSDFFGDVEANVGVNKANYFVTRKLDFKAGFNQGNLNRTLTINLENSANASLGPSGQYKTYLRILIPLDAKVTTATFTQGQSDTDIPLDITVQENRSEVGFYMVVNPGESKTVNLSWTSTLATGDITSYGLYIRKQAGTSADPIGINLNIPGKAISSLPAFALTKEGVYTYNTVLSRDFFSRLSWK